MKINLSIICLILISISVLNCVERQNKELTSEERARISPYILKQRPTPQHIINAKLEDRIELIGYDINTDKSAPGKAITITWYWHALKELDEGWKLFTHGLTGEGSSKINVDNIGVIRTNYQPFMWKKGEYIKDVQSIMIPKNWNSQKIQFRIGIWMGPHRLSVISGPKDNENRVIGPTIELSGVQIPQISKIAIPFISGEIQFDGKLVEPQWQKGSTTSRFVSPETGNKSEPSSTAKLFWDGKNIYIGFEFHDDHIFSTYTKRDEELWHQDVAEMFIDPDGDGIDYYEIQLSPANVIFDTKLKKAGGPRDDAFNIKAIKSAVALEGTLNNNQDNDTGWSGEIMIPLEELAPVPSPGQNWRLNLFRLDTGKRIKRSFLSWSPPLRNTTHVPSRFGEILFLGENQQPPPMNNINVSVTSPAGNQTQSQNPQTCNN